MNHSIKVVALKTGLSSHVIRVWEKRYGAVKPDRTQTNRRLYSEDEIQRLTLLRLATSLGHSISNVAKLTDADLKALVEQDRPDAARALSNQASAQSIESVPVESVTEEAVAAVERLDADALEKILRRASVELGQPALLHQVMVPLIERIGDRWREGSLKVAHEHLATAVIRTFLGSVARSYALPSTAPGLIVTTPAGQLHELGAILVAAAANHHGWRVTYLGPSLPAEEIAGAARQDRARAVGLSIVYPEDDPHLDDELVRLRQLLSPDVAILAGGRAAHCYKSSLENIGAIQLEEIPALYATLERLRRATKRK